jgi:hypothetical protein
MSGIERAQDITLAIQRKDAFFGYHMICGSFLDKGDLIGPGPTSTIAVKTNLDRDPAHKER